MSKERRNPIDVLTNHEHRGSLHPRQHNTVEVPFPTESWYFRNRPLPIPLTRRVRRFERKHKEREGGRESHRTITQFRTPLDPLGTTKESNQVTRERRVMRS